MPTFAEVYLMGDEVSAHLAYLAAVGRSDGTIRGRASILGRFADHMAPRTILEATEDDCVLWLNHPEWSRPTRRTYFANLAAFYKWAVRRKHLAESPLAGMERPKVPTAPPHPVPSDDFTRAVALATPRTRVWLILARYAGLRAAEVAGLQTEDIDWTTDTLTVHGKGSKEASLPMHPLVKSELRAWVDAHDGQTWDALPGDVSAAGRYALRCAGSAYTFHSLRHGFAMHLLDKYDDVALVSKALRHSSLAVTQVYAQTRDQRLSDAVRGMGLV